LKNRLGTYLRLAREGVTILVTDRGRPVAELRGLTPGETDEEERLAELAAHGLVTPRRTKALKPRQRVRVDGRPISDTIAEEREDRM